MEKLTNKEATFLIILLTINVIVLTASQAVVELCSSASLINTIFVSLIALLSTFLMCSLLKKFSGMDILDISQFLGGTILKSIVGMTFVLYFLFTIIVLLCKLTDTLQVVFYNSTSPIYIYLMFAITAGILCSFKNNALSKANIIFLPLTITTIFLIFIGNYKNFNFENIFPILGNGTNSIFGMGITNLFAFNGIALLYFLPSKLKSPEKFTKISLIAIFICSILFILCVAIILLMFNNELASSQLFPIYLSVRYIEFGTFFQRLDSAFLLFRIISFIAFLAVNTTLCLDIFKKVLNLTDNKPLLYPFLLLVFSLALFVRSSLNLEILQNLVFKIVFFVIVIGLSFILLILSNIKRKIKNNDRSFV